LEVGLVFVEARHEKEGANTRDIVVGRARDARVEAEALHDSLDTSRWLNARNTDIGTEADVPFLLGGLAALVLALQAQRRNVSVQSVAVWSDEVAACDRKAACVARGEISDGHDTNFHRLSVTLHILLGDGSCHLRERE